MSVKKLLKESISKYSEKNVTLVCEHNNEKYTFIIKEGDRVELPHKEVLTKATEFRKKLADKDYLLSLQKSCGFKEVDFENLVIKFQGANAKLNHAFMSLPAGVSCPGAGDCLTFYNPEEDKLYIASENEGRVCYAGAKEAGMGPAGTAGAASYRKMIYSNFYVVEHALKGGYKALAEIIDKSIKEHELDNGIMSEIRIHEDGDFYSEEYFKGWVKAAIDNPSTHFYFYTKSLPFLVKYLRNNAKFPSNFTPTISSNFNTKYKPFFEYYVALSKGDVKIAKIYDSYDEVPKEVPIDRTDAYAMNPDYKGEFALVYHGTGLKGSQAARNANKNAKDVRKEKTVEDKQYYITTVKNIRGREGDGSSLQINLDYK